MSEAIRDHLQGIAKGSPYEFGLQDISEYVDLVRCGLKVGGSQQNLLLIGAELSESQGQIGTIFTTITRVQISLKFLTCGRSMLRNILLNGYFETCSL